LPLHAFAEEAVITPSQAFDSAEFKQNIRGGGAIRPFVYEDRDEGVRSECRRVPVVVEDLSSELIDPFRLLPSTWGRTRVRPVDGARKFADAPDGTLRS
jgi:hypothetical protein